MSEYLAWFAPVVATMANLMTICLGWLHLGTTLHKTPLAPRYTRERKVVLNLKRPDGTELKYRETDRITRH